MPDNIYPLAAFYFKVKVEGFAEEIGFQEAGGISVEIPTEQVKEGGLNEYVHKLPKEIKYNNLVLKRGLMKTSPLMDWIIQAVEEFTFSPKMIEVSLLDNNGDVLINWDFQNAYPVAVKITDLNAQDGKIAIETLEFAYNYFKRKNP